MKKLATITAFLSISFIAHSQVVGTSTVPPKPVEVVEEALKLKEETFDFGKIPQGKPVTHVFAVENIGKDFGSYRNNIQAYKHTYRCKAKLLICDATKNI